MNSKDAISFHDKRSSSDCTALSKNHSLHKTREAVTLNDGNVFAKSNSVLSCQDSVSSKAWTQVSSSTDEAFSHHLYKDLEQQRSEYMADALTAFNQNAKRPTWFCVFSLHSAQLVTLCRRGRSRVRNKAKAGVESTSEQRKSKHLTAKPWICNDQETIELHDTCNP